MHLAIDNTLAMFEQAKAQNIDNYIEGVHSVLSRPDTEYKGKTFRTAKILLQSVKPILDFHSSYLMGMPISLTGDTEKMQMLNGVIKKGGYNKVNYDLVRSLYEFGNAYEYVFRDEKGVIKSHLIDAVDAYPIYEDGEYKAFIESWIDRQTQNTIEIIYYPDTVEKRVNGALEGIYNNVTGLPIHYRLDRDDTGLFGVGLVSDLMPIMNEIEALLSKMSDTVSTLNMNPLGVAMGDRVDAQIDREATGATLNIESGGDFKWASASLDYNSIKLLLDELNNQFYAVAQIPSALFGNGNVANVSETSLQLLFNQADNLAKKTALSVDEGLNKRWEYLSKLMGVDFTEVNVGFNYNRPVDNANTINNLKTLRDMGAISIESILRNSPYVNDVQKEMENLENEQKNKDMSKQDKA